MKSDLSEHPLRNYAAVIFKHKLVIITSVVAVMIIAVIGVMLITPVYEAHVKLLLTGKKETGPASYTYKTTDSGLVNTLVFNQCEIVTSYPVLERAAVTLKLYERPPDYEKNFCTPLKAWVIPLQFYVMNKLSKLNASSEPLSPEQKQESVLRQAVKTLQGNIKVEPVKDTDMLTITAKDFSPGAAFMLANVVGRAYVIFDLNQQVAELQTTYGEKYQGVTQLREIIDKMNRNLTVPLLSSEEAIGPASVKIIEQAQVPFEPKNTYKLLILILAFFMSISLGVMLALGFEYVDQTLKSPQEVEEFFDVPLLGSIPRISSKDKLFIKDTEQMTPYVQSYQSLADQIYLLIRDNNLKSIMITAISPLEGSTTIVANLSTYLSSRAGHKTLIIDANIRHPAIHKTFNISNKIGLADVLEGKMPLEKALQNLGHNLTILPAGETTLNPSTLLASGKLSDTIKMSSEKNEIVIIDYADLRHIKDVSVLSSYVDGIAIVINEGKTKRQIIKMLITPLEQKKSNIIGVILNKRTFAIPKMIYKWL